MVISRSPVSITSSPDGLASSLPLALLMAMIAALVRRRVSSTVRPAKGELVVTAGAHYLEEGQVVRILDQSSPEAAP